IAGGIGNLLQVLVVKDRLQRTVVGRESAGPSPAVAEIKKGRSKNFDPRFADQIAQGRQRAFDGVEQWHRSAPVFGRPTVKEGTAILPVSLSRGQCPQIVVVTHRPTSSQVRIFEFR